MADLNPITSLRPDAKLYTIGQRPAENQNEAITKAAKDFEAVFVSEMLSHMFKGIGTDPMFGGGNGEDMFRSMMVSEYGKMISNTGKGIGVSDQVQKTMIELQQKTGGAK